MFIRKSRISQLIKKERAHERKQVSREYEKKIRELKREMHEDQTRTVNELKDERSRELRKRDREIKKLKSEIQHHYATYQDVLKRERYLDELSGEMEEIMEKMLVSVNESVQPFYRTRSKVEAMKSRSAKKHDKVENIFRVANQ